MDKQYKELTLEEAEALIKLGAPVVWTRDCWSEKMHYVCSRSPLALRKVYEKSMFPAIFKVEVE